MKLIETGTMQTLCGLSGQMFRQQAKHAKLYSGKLLPQCGTADAEIRTPLRGSPGLAKVPFSKPGVGILPCCARVAYAHALPTARASSLFISAFPVDSTSFSRKPLQTKTRKYLEL